MNELNSKVALMNDDIVVEQLSNIFHRPVGKSRERNGDGSYGGFMGYADDDGC